MDESAPITWLIGRINELVTAGASATASTIVTTITPLVSVCFGIYVILITVNYLRGAESEPVFDFGLRLAGWAVVIGIGLNAANYSAVVIPIVTGIGGDIASAVSGGSATAGTLDQLALHYLQIIDDGFEAASSLDGFAAIGAKIVVCLKSIIIIFGLVPFLVVATLSIIVANVGSVMVAMVGPMFFAFLLFPATRQYFSAWLNSVLSFALVPIFVSVIAVMSIQLSKEMLSSGGGLLDASFKSVFLASVGNLVLLALVRMLASLASALSAGGVNIAVPGGVGALASRVQSGILGTGREARMLMGAYKGGKSLAKSLANRFNSIRKVG